jgi:hypothetical protein
MIDGEHSRTAEREWDITGGETLREALGDRGLPNAGRTDERGIVLAVTEQNVYHAGDLFAPAANRLETSLARIGGQVTREARENAVGLAGHVSASENR